MRILQQHFWKILAGVLTAFGAMAGIYQAYGTYVALHTPPPHVPSFVLNSVSESPSLDIVEAELKTQVVKRPFLWIFTWGADNFYEVNMLIKNAEAVSRSDCYALMEYEGPTVKGWSLLFQGIWPEWYKEGVYPTFDIDAGTAAASNFFSVDREQLRRLNKARVRVTCKTPAVQTSRWHDLDLSRAAWN